MRFAPNLGVKTKMLKLICRSVLQILSIVFAFMGIRSLPVELRASGYYFVMFFIFYLNSAEDRINDKIKEAICPEFKRKL